MLEFERQAWKDGHKRLAGVDEVGRGPLAGPVVAVALVFGREFLEAEAEGLLSEIDDSKKVPQSKREAIYKFLSSSPHVEIGIGSADHSEIDRLNIANATYVVMGRALQQLAPLPDHALVDGLPVPGLPCSSTAIVQGDGRSLSIAAASIVAKVVRDGIMRQLDGIYPRYGFAKHKGYGTKQHMKALLDYGPSPVHRMSFRPVRDAGRIIERMEGME
ncbi:MAG: ribonuclease HII [bacterium]